MATVLAARPPAAILLQMRRLWITLGIASLGACSFDSGGAGSGGTEGETEDTGTETSGGPTSGVTITTSTSTDSTSTSTTTDPSTTTDSTTSVDSTSTDGSTTDPTTGTDGTTGDDTTTGDPCANPPPVEELLWVATDATTADMQTFTSSLLPDGPNGPVDYAVSSTSGVGTVTWPFEPQCEGQLFFWGLVYDDEPGIGVGSADSYWFEFDEMPAASDEQAQTYVYGCGTEGLPPGWSWQPLNNTVDVDNQGMCVFEDIVPMTLTAGAHELVLLNREDQGGNNDVAAIAALVIHSDENFDPNTLYDPTP